MNLVFDNVTNLAEATIAHFLDEELDTLLGKWRESTQYISSEVEVIKAKLSGDSTSFPDVIAFAPDMTSDFEVDSVLDAIQLYSSEYIPNWDIGRGPSTFIQNLHNVINLYDYLKTHDLITLSLDLDDITDIENTKRINRNFVELIEENMKDGLRTLLRNNFNYGEVDIAIDLSLLQDIVNEYKTTEIITDIANAKTTIDNFTTTSDYVDDVTDAVALILVNNPGLDSNGNIDYDYIFESLPVEYADSEDDIILIKNKLDVIFKMLRNSIKLGLNEGAISFDGNLITE